LEIGKALWWLARGLFECGSAEWRRAWSFEELMNGRRIEYTWTLRPAGRAPTPGNLQEVGAWNSDVRRAVHRGVHRLRRNAEEAHTEILTEKAETAQREVEAITADIRMRRVLGLR